MSDNNLFACLGLEAANKIVYVREVREGHFFWPPAHKKQHKYRGIQYKYSEGVYAVSCMPCKLLLVDINNPGVRCYMELYVAKRRHGFEL